MSTSGDPTRQSSGYVDALGAQAYAENRHGIDGALLMDPIFMDHIRNFSGDGAFVADIGCGAAPWSIYAAKCGASAVRGFENSYQMLDQAAMALGHENPTISGIVEVGFGAVNHIPTEDDTFDLALSINVGCALPSRHEAEEDGGTLSDHFNEMNRVLRTGGFAVVTAPASLESVFTTFGEEEHKIADFGETLQEMVDSVELQGVVGQNTDILRATIVQSDESFSSLADNPGSLDLGSAVLRKVPGLVVPNYLHAGHEYEDSITSSGLEIVSIDEPTLPEEDYNSTTGLGSRYITDNPFAVYLLRKP